MKSILCSTLLFNVYLVNRIRQFVRLDLAKNSAPHVLQGPAPPTLGTAAQWEELSARSLKALSVSECFYRSSTCN